MPAKKATPAKAATKKKPPKPKPKDEAQPHVHAEGQCYKVHHVCWGNGCETLELCDRGRIWLYCHDDAHAKIHSKACPETTYDILGRPITAEEVELL